MDNPDFHSLLRQRFAELTPHVAECGMEILDLSAAAAIVTLPYRPAWIGDIERQVIHTGVIATLIDSACGAAVLGAIGRVEAIATIDLRVDYLRAAQGGLALNCRAECYRMTPNIAFARASVWQDDPATPVASSVGTFMRSSARRSQFKPTVAAA